MADASPLVRHFLRRCRRDGNVTYLDVLSDNFDIVTGERAGMVVTSGGANGQSYTFGELQGYSTRDIMAAKEMAYSVFAESTPEQLDRYLDRKPQNRTVATFGGCSTEVAVP
jgi:hypothetical protein